MTEISVDSLISCMETSFKEASCNLLDLLIICNYSGFFRGHAPICRFYETTDKTGSQDKGHKATRTCNSYWNPQVGTIYG